ncbi:MAG: hypothetical protein QOK05_1784 [Chloroflexota bacterium]|jgi:hypothetical protein|nr:hypothetical protein [Chloroflexota bacterium]
MWRAIAALGVVALTGCSGAGQPASPSPAAIAGGPARCHTADLEVRIARSNGAAGHVGLDFEVRNRSGQGCQVSGYFGLALLNSEGDVAIAATRSTRVFSATTGPPRAVILPAGTGPFAPPLQDGGVAAVAGHAHFAGAYSDVCDNATNGTGNAWQLYPPGDTVPTSVLTTTGQNITVCGLQVTPVQATPPVP